MSSFELKVYYEDTDAAGVVYYANYLKYLERARTQILIEKNLNHTILKEKYKIITAVKSCDINYIKPARLDDDLKILTTIIKKTKIQIFFDQTIYLNSNIIVKAKIRIVIIDIYGKIIRMPKELYNIL